MAMFVLMCWSSFARPSQLLALSSKYIFPPSPVGCFWSLALNPETEGQPSKTKDFDVSIDLDHKLWRDLGPLLEALRQRPPESSLWSFSYPELAMEVAAAARRMQTKLVVYQLRHSGASADAASGMRTLAETQKRGGWKQHQSVVRYTKASRLSQTWHRHSAEVRAHALECEAHLERILMHGITVPPPATR